jgi:hypothetical protein
MQEWQRQALDALSVWLVEDTQRMEPKLLVKRNIGILVAMFREAPHKPLERLIKPFKDMLTCSPKLCTHFSAQVLLISSCCSPLVFYDFAHEACNRVGFFKLQKPNFTVKSS